MLYFLQTAIPEEKHYEKGLQSIYGIGEYRAKLSLKMYGLLEDGRGKDLRRLHRLQLRANFDNFPRPLGGDLKQIISSDCQHLIDIQSYRGRRHKYGYPVRGQRTHTNAQNQKRLHKRWQVQMYDTPTILVKTKNKSLQTKQKKPKKK